MNDFGIRKNNIFVYFFLRHPDRLINVLRIVNLSIKICKIEFQDEIKLKYKSREDILETYILTYLPFLQESSFFNLKRKSDFYKKKSLYSNAEIIFFLSKELELI